MKYISLFLLVATIASITSAQQIANTGLYISERLTSKHSKGRATVCNYSGQTKTISFFSSRMFSQITGGHVSSSGGHVNLQIPHNQCRHVCAGVSRHGKPMIKRGRKWKYDNPNHGETFSMGRAEWSATVDGVTHSGTFYDVPVTRIDRIC